MKPFRRSFFWFRRDLRLNDNIALCKALEASWEVLPIFIFDIQDLQNLQDKKITFIYQSLLELKARLKEKGMSFSLFQGDPRTLLPQLVQQWKIEAVFVNRDYDPYSKTRDQKISQLLGKTFPFFKFKDHVIFQGEEIRKSDGTPFRVFSAYKRKWLSCLQEDPLELVTPLPAISMQNLAQEGNWEGNLKIENVLEVMGLKAVPLLTPGGESQAEECFARFQEKIDYYEHTRNFPALEGSSFLSPYLRYGNLSIRRLVKFSLERHSTGALRFLDELIWRDFFQMILDSSPQVVKEAFRPEYRHLPWPGKEEDFRAWCAGKTGFPFVDAGMRCLNQTGLMPNRLRMVTATFLTKLLLVDWRKGEHYFAEKLLDYDLAANNGGWQWCASTGCDATPYFRIFNPLLQSKKYDPEGEYIKKWCPELKQIPLPWLHCPWLTPPKVQQESHCLIGRDYPEPLIDYSCARIKTINFYKREARQRKD